MNNNVYYVYHETYRDYRKGLKLFATRLQSRECESMCEGKHLAINYGRYAVGKPTNGTGQEFTDNLPEEGDMMREIMYPKGFEAEFDYIQGHKGRDGLMHRILVLRPKEDTDKEE